MASYATIALNPVAGGDDTVQALVVTDGASTVVLGATDVAESLRDVDWGVGDPETVLRYGLTGLSYFTIAGPHTFDGDTATAAAALGRSYGLG